MTDFDRFWLEGNRPYADDDDTDDETQGAAEIPPGVTDEEIAQWERAYGVRLPEPLRTALTIRNGGFVRNTTIQVLPLDQIVPVDDEFWEWTELDEDEAPDHDLMFVFGDETETGATFLMNFNARGPKGVPSVYLDHHGESTYLVNKTIGGLFGRQMASDAEPGVDWSETESGLDVIARERVDLSALYHGKPATEELVLAQKDGALVLFEHIRSVKAESFSRTTLPLPLDPMWAEIRPRRPAPIGTFGLHLQPAERDGIVGVRSERNADGRWKTTTSHGTPIYAMFESTDRDRLVSLRMQLLGEADAARAQGREDRQAELLTMLESLSPEQRSAAMLQATLGMKEEHDRQFEHLGPPPPELAGLAESLRLRMEEVSRRARERIAANPVDPETLRRIQELMRDRETE